MEHSTLTESNRQIVETFVEKFYKQKNVRQAFLDHVVENYIQHNPTVMDGRNAAIEMLEPKFSNPEAQFDIKKIIVDGDLAAVHLHGRLMANTLGVAVVDMYRLENGKIVEHWDVLQPVPAEKINPRPIF